MTTSSAPVLSVFVVLLCSGRYDDYRQTVARTFTDRSVAENFVARKNDAICHVQGMAQAVSKLMEEWEKVNPAPPTRYSREEGIYSEEATTAHYDLRNAEEERLSLIVGLDAEWEKLKLDRYDGRDAHYMFVESKLDGDAWVD
jgi:hypothetical protein